MQPIQILYEDAYLLVIDKPAGISVVDENEGETPTVKDWVKDRYNLQYSHSGVEDEFEQRLGIVHRLDKETSGVLLIARSKEAFDYLKGLFKFRRIQKEYQVLVYGSVKEDKFEISAPIQRNKNNGLLYNIDQDGRQSATEFVVKLRFQIKNADYSYLGAFPTTGRTHQIRVHLKALGHPVVNDRKYANKTLLKLSEELFNRMMLHAKKVTFTDRNGQERIFESPNSLYDIFPVSR
ncbi:MAG: RluA family pseudouridine synthase [Patescibacteria group bacterium]